MNLFKMIDKSYDGSISIKEFTKIPELFSKCDLEFSNKLFRQLDINKDGYICYTEFTAGAMDKDNVLTDSNINGFI